MPDFPPFRLDPINQCLWRLRETAQDERILLPPKAFAVLRYLVAHAGQLVTQDELLAAVWPETYIKPEVLKSRIFEVRSALGDRPKTPRFIETLPRRGYRFIAPVHASPAVASVLPAPPAPGHLMGRAGVLETLRAYLRQALHGQRQLVFVTGEPGIGKTALVDAFQQQGTGDVPGLRLARGQCLEGYGGMEAYYPVLEALGAVCREADSAAIIELLARHAPTWLVQFPALLTRAHRDTLQRELQGATRERMLRELAELLEVLTADRPLLLVLEDLQWVDPATVDVLAALARRRAPAQLLVVGTYRPVDMAREQPPLRALTQDLLVHQLCHELAVEPLSEADVAAYLAAAAAGAPLPEGLAGLVYRHSAGNPLFMRAVLDHLTQQGILAREPDGWQLRVPIAAMAVGVPERVRQMLDTQIGHLRPEAQRLLEVASVAGMVTVAPSPALDRPCPPAAVPPLPPHPTAAGAAPAPLVSAPSPAAVPAQDTAHELGAAGPDRPAAEWRQVTILCCDLAGSTALLGQLDPEDLREVLQVYWETCTGMIAHYEGHVDTFMGDRILVCFGYPQAHDDDPQRAVRAGLGIVEALVRVNPHIDQTWGVQLAVRLGIHTGLVVAGELGRGATRDPQAIVGEAPNIATRLQELAAPNTVVCSAATARLVEGYFPLETLSPQELTGVATPLPVYRVVDEPRVQTRFDVARTRGLTPLVGRASEVALLWERWAQAQDGQGQVVLLSGEAGIGKSRLVQAFTAQLTGEASAQIVCQCSPYAQQRAFAPLIAHLQRLLQLRLDDNPTEQLCRLETTLAAYALPLDEAVPLMAALLALPLPERYLPLPLTPQHQKQQTLATLLAWLLREAERQPICMVFEDLHWVDPSTQEWLSLLIDQLPTARVLLLLLFRPEFQPPWAGRSYLTQLALGRLSPRQTEGMISQVVGGTSLPLEVLQQVVATTDGVPLFVEELTKMIVELGLVKEREGRYELTGPLPALAIPATLHDSLMARLDRLGPAKQIAQLGAVVGREFPYEMLQAMTPVDEGMVAQGLAQLVEVELLYQRGLPPRARYTFKHALMQEVAYNSILLRRRQELHRAVGYAIEARYPGRLAEHYEALAHHFMHGARWSKALEYSTLAGDRAAEVFANVEANAHYSHALQATEQLTPPADAGVVARLHAKQGAILEPLGEYEAAITAWERALALIRQTGERQEEIDILVGLSGIYNSAHREEPATRYSLQALALARALNDRARLAVCLIQRAAIRSVAAGQLVEAIPEAEEALRLARDISEPKALAQTLVFLGSLLQWRAEFDRSLRYLREGVELAQQTHTGPLLGNAAFCIGHARAAQGAYEDALHWYQKLSDYAVAARDTFWLARLPNTVGGVHLDLFNSAEALRLNLEGEESAQQYSSWPEPRGHSVVKAGLAYLQQGQHGHAEVCFRRAETLVEADTWMRWRWHMVLLRAWGELALAQGRPDDAWTYACQSLELATRSHSRKHIARAQLLQGEVFRVWGRLGEAAYTLAAAVHLAEQIGTPRERWLGQATLGNVLRQLGREQEGETYLTQATQTIEAIAAHLRTWPLRHSFLRATPVLAVYAALGHRPPPATP